MSLYKEIYKELTPEIKNSSFLKCTYLYSFKDEDGNKVAMYKNQIGIYWEIVK